MANKSLVIRIDSELYDALRKRAKKSFFNVDELVEDIIRRSMLSYSGGPSRSRFKVDDKLVDIFSRERRTKRKKTKKKAKKK